GTPGPTVSVSVVVHGPGGLVANVPRGELELSVTVSGAPVVTGAPEAVVNEMVDGVDGAPAATVSVGGGMARSGCVQVRNDRQASLCVAPGMSTLHSVSSPGGPHAPVPVVSGSAASPEAWIAAESRSRS